MASQPPDSQDSNLEPTPPRDEPGSAASGASSPPPAEPGHSEASLRHDDVSPLAQGVARARVARRRSNPLGRILFFGVIALVLFFIIGIRPRIDRNRELNRWAKEQAAELPALTIVKAVQAPPIVKLTLPGNVEALAQTPIYARSSGYLKRFFVDIGDRVKPGQLLALVETPDLDQEVNQAQADLARSQATVAQARALLAQADSGLQQMLAQEARARTDLQQAIQTSNQQRAQVAQAEASADLARVTWQRWSSLVEGGAVSRQEADQQHGAYTVSLAALASARASLNASLASVGSFRNDLKAAQAEVQAAVANVKSSQSNVTASQAAVNSAQDNLNRLQVLGQFREVRAPYAGVIVSRNIDVGSLISSGGSSESTGPSSSGAAPGSTTGAGGSSSGGASSTAGSGPTTSLFTLSRIDQLVTNIDIPQTYTSSIHRGESVHVAIAQLPLHDFSGVISRMAESLDPTARTERIQIALANPRMELLPGMYAEVEIDAASTKPPIMVPSSALITDAKGMRVEICDQDNTVHYRTVAVGHDYGSTLEVTSGLQAGDMVVSNPISDLVEGAKVKPTVQKGVTPAGGPPPSGAAPVAAPSAAATSKQ